MSLFQMFAIAYSITGLVRVVLQIPVLRAEWSAYDVMMEENLSQLEQKQLSQSAYNVTKYLVFGAAVVLTGALWPTMRFREKKDDG